MPVPLVARPDAQACTLPHHALHTLSLPCSLLSLPLVVTVGVCLHICLSRTPHTHTNTFTSHTRYHSVALLQSNMLGRSSVAAPGPAPSSERATFRADIVRVNLVVLLHPGEAPQAGDVTPPPGAVGPGALGGAGGWGPGRTVALPRWRLPHRRFGESLRDVDGVSMSQYRCVGVAM